MKAMSNMNVMPRANRFRKGSGKRRRNVEASDDAPIPTLEEHMKTMTVQVRRRSIEKPLSKLVPGKARS
jgi:hypothetical protein